MKCEACDGNDVPTIVDKNHDTCSGASAATDGHTHVKCESRDCKAEWNHSKTDLKLIRHDMGSEIASVSTITNIKFEPRECNKTWNHNINMQHRGSDVQSAWTTVEQSDMEHLWIDSTLALKVEVNEKMAFPRIRPD